MDDLAMETAFEPDDWLRRNDALRRIARALVGDENRADDVVQNAYLAALERPPAHLSTAWFRRVVESRAFDALRRERRRRETPLEAGEIPPAPDVARQLELHGVLISAVRELSEPYQRVVYLRYFEGRTPAEIAVELGAPVKTVKTRLHRALAQLRERLGREYGPDNWARALVGTFGVGSREALEWLGTATVAGGLSIMAKKIAVVLVVLSLAVWGGMRWTRENDGLRGTQPVDRQRLAAAAPAESPVEELAETSAPPAEREAVEPGSVPAPTAAAPVTGTLVVEATWADGTAAAGVGIHLRRGGGGSSLPYLPVDRVATDPNGVARFENVPPGAAQVNSDRHNFRSTQQVSIVAGRETVVDFQVSPGIAVDGIVRDASGREVPNASIWLTTGHADWLGGHVIATTDADGRFSLRDVPPIQSLGAFARGHGRSALVDLETLDTTTQPVPVALALTADGGALRGVVTGPDGAPIAGATVSAGEYALADWGPGQEQAEVWTALTAETDEKGEFALFGLPVGELPLRARAPALSTWKGAVEIQGGATSRIDIALAQGATIEGIVSDIEGQPLGDAVVRAFDEEVSRHFLQSGQYDYKDIYGYPVAKTDAEGRYFLTGIPAGTVYVYANPHRDPRAYHVKGLMRAEDVLYAEPGDRLVWNPVVSEGHVIDGIVTYRDGEPMENVFLSARNDETGIAQAIRSDTDGTFRFVNMDNAPHVLGVQLWDAPKGAEPVEASGVWPDQGLVELVASYDKPVDEELGTVRGTIEDAGERAERVENLTPILESDQNFARVLVERDGAAFVFPDVKPGRYRPILVAGDDPVFAGEWFELGAGEDRDVGVLATEPAGSVLVRIAREEGTEEVEAVLFIRPEGLMHARRVELGFETEVLLTNMTGGRHTVGVYGHGILVEGAEVSVEVGKEVELPLEFKAAVRQPIEISWPENEALGSLTLRVEDDLGGVPWESTQPNVAFLERPYTQSPNLPVGSYTVTATSKSGLRGTASVRIVDLDSDRPVLRVEMR